VFGTFQNNRRILFLQAAVTCCSLPGAGSCCVVTFATDVDALHRSTQERGTAYDALTATNISKLL